MSSDRKSKRPVNMRLPESLIDKVDALSKILHKNRTEITKEALREFVRKMEVDNGVRKKGLRAFWEGEIDREELETYVSPSKAEAVELARKEFADARERVEEIEKLFE